MMQRQRSLPVGACALLILLAPGPTASAEDARLKGLDEYVKQSLRDWEVPGLAIAIVKDDAVVLARGYGVRKLGESTPVNDRTLFAIASCSKAFTAAALAMLVDEGKIAWDDPVRKHLRNFQLRDGYASGALTVRDLLCHRSGLPRYDLLWYGSAASRDDILRRLRYARPRTTFRNQFGYQNIMFLAAGQVIPAVTGASWDDFVKRRIFEPLGMTASNTSIKAFAGANVATPHLRLDDRVKAIPWRNIDNAGPAGSINSNVRDMAQWLRLQLNKGVYNDKRLLTTKSFNEMHTPQSVIHPEGMGPEGQFWELTHPGSRLLVYGLGWVLREYRSRVLVQHGGAIDGMRSLVLLVPDDKLGIVILTNRGGQYLPEAIAQRVLDAHLGAPPRDWSTELLKVQNGIDRQRKDAEKRVEKERVKGTRPSLPAEKYAGTYQDNLYGEVTVTKEGDKLVVRYGPSLTGTLAHWHHDTFQVTWIDRTSRKGLVTFRLDRKGEADEIRIWHPSGGEEIAARRAPVRAKEPAIVLKPEELRRFVGVYSREAPPLQVTVELLHGKLKLMTFGLPVATLVPIAPARFRVAGAASATYLEFEMAEGKIKQALYKRGDAPPVKLVPGK
jgi:CubicO group peptidase (beta-lactamase class C family)